MKKREALELAEHHLGLALGPDFRKSTEGFTRRFEDGFDALFVGFWAYPPDFVFTVTPAVRLNAVEKLYHQAFDTDFKKTTTVLTNLWRFDGPARPAAYVPLPNSGSPYFFTFTDEESARQAVARLRPRLVNQVLPFYEGLRSASDVHRALNVDLLDTSNDRMFHGLVAAFMADGPGWRALAKRYAAALAEWPAADRARFRVAVERLEAMEAG
jgi:hypothetical protein